eukprot:364205-Chlamydomonas_euryale.AAC.6
MKSGIAAAAAARACARLRRSRTSRGTRALPCPFQRRSSGREAAPLLCHLGRAQVGGRYRCDCVLLQGRRQRMAPWPARCMRRGRAGQGASVLRTQQGLANQPMRRLAGRERIQARHGAGCALRARRAAR